jgi:death-on-curing protein
MTNYLSQEQILALHQQAIARFGGSAGVQDKGALESAVAQPQMTFGGVGSFAGDESSFR